MYMQSAMEAARLGGEVLRKHLNDACRKRASAKLSFDFVTEVDLLSEKAILGYLRERHPEHRILAEESGGARGESSDWLWIVDPLDGTANYIHGIPHFCVSVALLQGEDLLAGAIYDPLRDELFHAEKGGGAWLNGETISVSSTADPAQGLLATGLPFRARQLNGPYFEALAALFARIGDFRRAGSAALDLAYVACGRLDGFWEVTLSTWDIAAGMLLIAEAGGRTSDVWGEGSPLWNGHIAASNGLLHDTITGTVGPFFIDREAMDART